MNHIQWILQIFFILMLLYIITLAYYFTKYKLVNNNEKLLILI